MLRDEPRCERTYCQSTIAVVHNGIIENYSEVRDRLQEKGHVFASDTDTEVITHLIKSSTRPGHGVPLFEEHLAIAFENDDVAAPVLLVNWQRLR